MATNKNQHFVPRCYLKMFTLDNEDKSINIFNVDRAKVIVGAPVKNQCSGDYFYGKDPLLESSIQAVEGPYSPIIRSVHEQGYTLLEEHAMSLKEFWLFQYMRTEAASKRSVEMTNEMADIIDRDGNYGYDFRLKIKDAVNFAVKRFPEAVQQIYDLKICLVRNNSEIPFVTSDDPAILTNRWHLQYFKRRGFSFGLVNSGVIGMLPLSPAVLLVIYDSDVYSLDKKNGWVNIKKDSEIKLLNQHQYLNCIANIFIGEKYDPGILLDSYTDVAKSKPKQRHRLHHAILDREEDGCRTYKKVTMEEASLHRQVMVHTETVHPSPSKWASLFRWRVGGTAFSNGTGVGYVRRAFAYDETRPFAKVKI